MRSKATRRLPIRIKRDDYDLLRSVVYQFFKENKPPRAEELRKAFIDEKQSQEPEFNCSLRTFYKALRQAGFRWRKTKCNRKVWNFNYCSLPNIDIMDRF